MAHNIKDREFRFKGYESLVVLGVEEDAEHLEFIAYKEVATNKLYSGIAQYNAQSGEWVVFGSEIIMN